MIGTTLQNNDIYIFFENDEIQNIKGTICGTYINRKDCTKGMLEVLLNDRISDLAKTLTKKEADGTISLMHLEIMGRVYEKLKLNCFVELHEGYRHIRINDANDPKMHFSQKSLYESLKGANDLS